MFELGDQNDADRLKKTWKRQVDLSREDALW